MSIGSLGIRRKIGQSDKTGKMKQKKMPFFLQKSASFLDIWLAPEATCNTTFFLTKKSPDQGPACCWTFPDLSPCIWPNWISYFSNFIVGSPENYSRVENFVVEHAYPSQSLINFALQKQGKSLILEGVTIFNHEILNLKIIFGTSRCQIRKIYYPKRLYTWGEVWERPATCRALVGLFFL